MYHFDLPFSPRASVFANGHYLRDHAGEAKALIGINETWSPEIRSIHTNRQIDVLEYSHDGTMLAAASAVDATVWIFRAATGERMAEFSSDLEAPLSGYDGFPWFSFSADDRILAVTHGQSDSRSRAREHRHDSTNHIALWDITTGTKLIVLPPVHRAPICAITFSPTNNPLLVSIDESGLLVLWSTSDLNAEEHHEHHQMLQLSGASREGVIAWIPGPTHRNMILVGFQYGRIEMRDIVADPNRCLSVFWVDLDGGDQELEVVGITVSGDGCWFASHSEDRITVHNIETAEAVISFTVEHIPSAFGSTARFRRHYFFASTSGKTASSMLAFLDGADSLSFIPHVTYDSQRSKPSVIRLQSQEPDRYFRSVALSPNGQLMASISKNQARLPMRPLKIKIYDTSALAASPMHTVGSNEIYIGDIGFPHFSPDGRFIVAVSRSKNSEQNFAVWTVADGPAACQPEAIKCHELRDIGYIVDIAFLSDSRYILSIDDRGVLELWDWKQKRLLYTDTPFLGYGQISVTAAPHYTLYPFTYDPLGFSLTYSTLGGDHGIHCWLVETDPPCFKLLGKGILPVHDQANTTSGWSRVREGLRGNISWNGPLRIDSQIPDSQDTNPSLFTLIVEYQSTGRFSTSLKHDTDYSETLEWTELVKTKASAPSNAISSEAHLVRYDKHKCVGPEIPILVSKNREYIVNKYGKKLFLIPPAYRGPGRWHEKKLLLWNEGRMLLLDFSQVNIDEPDDVLF